MELLYTFNMVPEMFAHIYYASGNKAAPPPQSQKAGYVLVTFSNHSAITPANYKKVHNTTTSLVRKKRNTSLNNPWTTEIAITDNKLMRKRILHVTIHGCS